VGGLPGGLGFDEKVVGGGEVPMSRKGSETWGTRRKEDLSGCGGKSRVVS